MYGLVVCDGVTDHNTPPRDGGTAGRSGIGNVVPDIALLSHKTSGGRGMKCQLVSTSQHVCHMRIEKVGSFLPDENKNSLSKMCRFRYEW